MINVCFEENGAPSQHATWRVVDPSFIRRNCEGLHPLFTLDMTMKLHFQRESLILKTPKWLSFMGVSCSIVLALITAYYGGTQAMDMILDTSALPGERDRSYKFKSMRQYVDVLMSAIPLSWMYENSVVRLIINPWIKILGQVITKLCISRRSLGKCVLVLQEDDWYPHSDHTIKKRF